jgi:hypothetical protein
MQKTTYYLVFVKKISDKMEVSKNYHQRIPKTSRWSVFHLTPALS